MVVSEYDYQKAWEKRVGPGTCHIGGVPGIEKIFEDATRPIVNNKSVTVLDYGCGGGLLGEYLTKHFDVDFYAGVDVAERSVEAAKDVMKRSRLANKKWDIKKVPSMAPMIKKEFEYLFCLNVIQHMPDHAHLSAILKSLNQSKAKIIILNFRVGGKLKFADHPYKTTKEINLANSMPRKIIDNNLTNYTPRETQKQNDDFQLVVYDLCQ